MSRLSSLPFPWPRAVCWLPLVAAMACATTSPTPSNTPTPAPAVASTAATGGAAADRSPPLPLDPRVTTRTLANGLTYLLQRQKPEDKRAYLMLVVKAGSLHEEDDQRGFAHLAEHMAFNGTTHFEKHTLIDFFEKSGIKFGSDTNAFTSYDQTRFVLNVPTDQPELLLRGLDVLEDWASGVSFEPEEVDKERPVVLAELTRALGAGRRMTEQVTRALLAGSRYVDRETIGDPAVIEKGPRQRLVDFYRRWYRPERMAVVVTGDIDTAAVGAAIEQRFSGLARASEPLPALDFHVPIGTQPTATVITDPEVAATGVSFLLKTPPRVAVTEADARESLFSTLAAGMLSRRLSEVAESPSAPFTGAGSQYVPNRGGQIALLGVSAQAKEGKLPASLESLLLEVERVKRHGFTSSELERTARDVSRALEHRVAGQDTAEARGVANALADSFIIGEVVTSPKYDQEFFARILATTSLEDINRAAVAVLSTGEPLLIASGASRDAMPEQSALLAALSSAARQPVTAYQDKVAQGQLMPVLPEPGRVAREEHIAEIDTTVWTLSNGAVVVLKPTDFKKDEIIEQSISFGGTARVPPSAFSSARFANDIVVAGGVSTFDRQALRKMLSGKQAIAYPWIGEQDEGIRARSAPEDVETMFQLMHLYATAPRRDEAAFETYRASLRENLRNRDLIPSQVFGDAVSKKVWGGSPRRSAPTLKSVDEVDLDSVMKFYAERFKDMSDFTFVFVGKIDLPAFKPLVERYLASLPGGGRKEKPRDIGLHRRKGVTEVSAQAGKEDKAIFTLTFHGESPWSENAHTDLYTLGEYLSMRLREVLREEMGGVYSPQVSSDFDRVPFDSYSLQIAFECKPKDVDALEKAARGVIADVKKSGVGATYVEKLTSERTRGLEQSYRSNGFWLERLVDKYKLHEDPRQILILPELTKRVTSDNLRAAARHFLRDDQYIEARLTPVPGAPPAAPGPLPAGPAPAAPASGAGGPAASAPSAPAPAAAP
jgi:zinc protease